MIKIPVCSWPDPNSGDGHCQAYTFMDYEYCHFHQIVSLEQRLNHATLRFKELESSIIDGQKLIESAKVLMESQQKFISSIVDHNKNLFNRNQGLKELLIKSKESDPW